jgi:hypothetical protein
MLSNSASCFQTICAGASMQAVADSVIIDPPASRGECRSSDFGEHNVRSRDVTLKMSLECRQILPAYPFDHK